MRTKPFVAAAALVASLFIQASAALSDGLIAYYPFDGNAQDVSGNGNHGTPAGTFQFNSSGRYGSALRVIGDRSLFYAGGGHIVLPSFGAEMNQGFTISFWTKDEEIGGNPTGYEEYVSFGILNLPQFGIGLNNNTPGAPFVKFYMDAVGTPSHPGAVYITRLVGDLATFAASWKHFVLVYEPGKVKAFLNGEKIGEGAITFTGFPLPKAALAREWWDGGQSSSARMSVTYDDVRIYGRAVTDAEVAALYNSPDSAAQRIAELEAQVAELAAENLALSAANEALTNQISDLQAELTALATQLLTEQENNIALTTQISELNAGLDEIRRLLKLPKGKRTSTYRATGPHAPKINAIIDILTGAPGKTISMKNGMA